MDGKIKIAHAGAGYWGKNIVRNLAEMGLLDTLCDSDPETLNALKTQYSIESTTSTFDDILQREDIRAVTIATPAATHYDLAKAALKAGKDVFVEKPLALKTKHGEKLAGLARESGRVLMVGHILRYHPVITKIKELIDTGAVGRVGYCYSNRLNLGRVRKEENILWSFAPHDISVLNYIMGGPPDEVSATGEVILQPGIHDVTLTVLKWHGRGSAHINVSWLHPFKEHRFVVVGDKAMLVFDDTKETDKLVLYDRGIDFVKGVPVKRDENTRAIEFEQKEPLRAELEHFVKCVQTRQTPRTDAQEALDVLRVLTRAQKSLEGDNSGKAGKEKHERAYFAHETAIIDDGAKIGKDTKVWHFSHVMGGAKIGEKCSLGQNVLVARNAVIGNNVKIQNNVSVYEGVILEDNCFCGPSMVFTNVKNPRSAIPRNTSDDYLKTHIKRGATLGANSTIVCGSTVGENAFVAAGAVVAHDVPPNALVAGVPARQIGWMCDCGFRLRKKDDGLSCPECGNRYSVDKNGELKPA